MDTIAFLGTGLIGAGMVEAARRRGEAVRVWNRTPAKAAALAKRFGATASATAAEAVSGASRVHVSLSDDAAVDAVLEAALAGGVGDALVVDHTTTSVAGTARRAAALEARGVAFLHAPVFMSPKMAREGKGLIVCAGPGPRFERARPALEAMTGEVWYVGAQPERAAAFKLFGNAIIVAQTAALADVFAMAKALGIPAPDAHALFSHQNPGAVVQYRGGAMARGDYAASFELSMARKDVRLMLEAAGDEGLTVLPAIAKRMDELLARGHAADDLGVLSIDAVPRTG
jgi:3-hydroxyisobutyrate dehydrogenase-like beta-hydroxyacid dehydrogenase